MGKGTEADRKESVLHVQKQSNNLEPWGGLCIASRLGVFSVGNEKCQRFLRPGMF